MRTSSRGLGLLLALPIAGGVWLWAAASPQAAAPQGQDPETIGPHASAVDFFHPDRERVVQPGWGGTVTVHLPSLPRLLNHSLDNTSYVKWMLHELHETLVARDWETWEFEPVLCTSWDVQDRVILQPSAAGAHGPEDAPGELWGQASETADAWLVAWAGRTVRDSDAGAASGGASAGAGQPLRLPKADVERVERQTVYTFHLRSDVTWHDGHPFDARDVVFSWEIFQNPEVDCDALRPEMQKVLRAFAPDAHTVTFVYERQYFNALDSVGDICILPAHLYDLADADCAVRRPDATPSERARFVNENEHNTRWVGLGPYRLLKYGPDVVEAERFPGYFDPAHGGYLDRIRWRILPDDNVAYQALLNGELDFFFRMGSAMYFGESSSSEEFQQRFYKGYFYGGSFGYVAWNTRVPELSDLRVRRALAHCFDWPEYIRTLGHGLGKQVTGFQPYFHPAYERGFEPYPYDLERARTLLADAGWYDRDGDGLIDQDGRAFAIRFLYPSSAVASAQIGQKLQENLARVGIRLELVSTEYATLKERIRDKDFDCFNLVWVLSGEVDAEQLWSSAGAAPDSRGSNYASVADPQVDALIERAQRELDDEARWQTWRELQRYLYFEWQPYLYGINTPIKFAMNRRMRGFQAFQSAPGFSIRRWYFPRGTLGIRGTRENGGSGADEPAGDGAGARAAGDEGRN
jgi:peptide/nickel transport system substrate-binding protein